MRMRKPVSAAAIIAGTFLLMLVLPGSTSAVGTCHSSKGCPCTPDQEKQGMKTIGGNCVDCAGNAKKLDEIKRNRMALSAELEKQKELAEEGGIKSDHRWYQVHEEDLPQVLDAVQANADLQAQVLGIGGALQNSDSSGAYQLREHLKKAYLDMSRMAKVLEPPQIWVPRLLRDLSDSVRYADQYVNAKNAMEGLPEEIDNLGKQIEELLKVKAKCDGKSEKKSEQKSLENSGIYAARLPELLRLVASSPSATNPNQSPCRGSRENLKRCEEAQQVLSDVRGLDLPETNVAFREVLRILEPFGRDNADKIADQEVRQRAKESKAALNKLAELLDRLVSRSKKVLALLQGGGA